MPNYNGYISNLTDEEIKLFPHIIQFSWISYNLENKIINSFQDEIIKIPEEVIVTVENSNIHGITKKISQEKGKSIKNIIEIFIEEYKNTDLIVGHNIQFDKKIICVEILRIIKSPECTDKKKWWEYLRLVSSNSKNMYCTMKNSVNVCNLQYLNKKGVLTKKFPKLIELYSILFPEDISNIQIPVSVPVKYHNSLYDCFITLKCYIKITQKYDLSSDLLSYLFT
jgi:DNA polymerase III epsilon subunit-like protein